MSEDAEHEVIDSPQALFRHLYEAHHVQEARDLDPATAPVKFWARRHAELEGANQDTGRLRDTRGTREARDIRQAGDSGDAGRRPHPQPEARPRSGQRPQPGPRPQGQRLQPEQRPQPEHRPQPEQRAPAPEDWWAPPRGDGQFDDPLVEAVVMALVGRGHDERRVRGFVGSYVSPDGRRTGADGVRAWFLGPVLDAIADRLAAAPAGRAADPVPDDDVMAIADAVQGRRGSRAGRDSRPGRPAAPPDDVMAIAEVLQRRRTGQGGA